MKVAYYLPLVWAISASIAAAKEPDKPLPAKPMAHTNKQVEGWTVHVDTRLLEGEGAEVGERSLRLLANRLSDIVLILPKPAVERLREVPIWLDQTHGNLHAMQYHPSTGWLTDNGYAADLAKCVHIPEAADFSSVRHQQVQPWSVLHELSHAYHDQVLDFENPEIKAAWQRFADGGRYQKTLHIDGHETKHYALTNQMEFFAELSESYFGMNDFYPFNRGELRQQEPEIFALLGKVWNRSGAELHPPSTSPAPAQPASAPPK